MAGAKESLSKARCMCQAHPAEGGKKRRLSKHEARQNSDRRVEVSTQLREENTQTEVVSTWVSTATSRRSKRGHDRGQ
jgi:hypothetical protein